LGKEAAVKLAALGAEVIILCRNPTNAQAAVTEIKERSGWVYKKGVCSYLANSTFVIDMKTALNLSEKVREGWSLSSHSIKVDEQNVIARQLNFSIHLLLHVWSSIEIINVWFMFKRIEIYNLYIHQQHSLNNNKSAEQFEVSYDLTLCTLPCPSPCSPHISDSSYIHLIQKENKFVFIMDSVTMIWASHTYRHNVPHSLCNTL
jgi:hypothetical protein